MQKRNWRKVLGVGMSAMMLAGCLPGGNVLQTKADDVVKIRIHTLLSDQTDTAEVMEAVNEYTREKIGVEVEYVCHGGSYGDKIQTIIASGEEYDACFTSNWLNSYNTNVAKGAFLDIKDMLPEVAPKLWELLPESFWTASTINGGIYGVPNQQIVARQMAITMPKEFLEGTGEDGENITNFTNLTDYAQKAYDQFGAKVAGMPIAQCAEYCGYEYINDYLSAGVIQMNDETAQVVNLYETEEWINMLNEMVALEEKGLLDGECGYMDEYSASQRRAHKLSVYFGGTCKPGVEAEELAAYGIDGKIKGIDVKPYISTSSIVATMYGISSTSKHPEETLKYLELLNTDPYLMNLVCFGIEGKHYNKTGETTIELVPNSGYTQSSWAVGNVFNTYSMSGQPEDIWEQTKALNDSGVLSPVLGFSFDPEPVKTEIASVSKVVKEYESIIGGTLPVEETNAKFVEKLKVAGVDTIIEEMQRQIDEFLAAK